MRNIWKKTVFVISLCGMLGVMAVYADFTDILKVENHISTGDVNIDLKEYTKIGKKEVPYENPKIVFPGDVISKIPRVKNYAKPCWIRAKITYTDDSQEAEGLSDENLSGFPTGWIKRGEYYYYTEILNRFDSVHIFEEVHIPDAWTEIHSTQELTISIQAEAIQADHFVPDFQAMSPWGNEKIQLCIHENNNQLCCTKQNVKLSVVFHGKANKLVAAPDDFFSNFGKIMPGDTLSDSILISNTTDRDAEIFFYTGISEQSGISRQMLEEIQLQIQMDNRVLYSGPLNAEGLRNRISLGIYKPGESGKMEFSLEVPASWDNSYAKQETNVIWNFAVWEEEEKITEKVIPDDPSDETVVYAEQVESVKTGDASDRGIFITALLSAVAVITVVLAKKKGDASK